MTDKTYFALPDDSQSSIKAFKENRKAYEYTYVKGLGEGKKTKALDLGTLNHCLLFENQEFVNRYATFEGEVPNSPQAWKFYDLCWGEKDMSPEDAYVNSYSCKSKTPATIVKESGDMFNKYEPYGMFMRTNRHKELITNEQELLSRRMIEIFWEHEGVQKTLFADRLNPKYDNYREVAIRWNYYLIPDRPLKCKIDEVCVDVKNKIAYAYDYKTTRSQNMKSFTNSIKYYGYDIQASFYIEAIKVWLKEKYGEDFTVVFRFIPQLNIAPFNVLDVIEIEEDDINAAFDVWTEELSEIDNCRKTGRFDNPSAYTDSGVNKVRLGKEVVVLDAENTGF